MNKLAAAFVAALLCLADDSITTKKAESARTIAVLNTIDGALDGERSKELVRYFRTRIDNQSPRLFALYATWQTTQGVECSITAVSADSVDEAMKRFRDEFPNGTPTVIQVIDLGTDTRPVPRPLTKSVCTFTL